jgi:hypothetical protein
MGQAYCMQDHDVWFFFFDGWPFCLVDWMNTYRVNISIVWLPTHLPDARFENGRVKSRLDPHRFPHFTHMFLYFRGKTKNGTGPRIGGGQTKDGKREGFHHARFIKSRIYA